MENLETKQTEVEILKFNLYDLPSYKDAKAAQEELVRNNPFIEVVDKVSYEEGKKRRTALVKGRTALQEGEKVINRRLTDIKRFVSSETSNLISITQEHEERQQTEVKRYETEIEEEKNRAIRIENERKQKIKDDIEGFRKQSLNAIKNATIEDIDTIIESIENYNLECYEFSDDLDLIKNELELTYEPKRRYLIQDRDMAIARQKMELSTHRYRLLVNYGCICNEDLAEMDEDSFLSLLKNAEENYILSEQKKELERKELEDAKKEIERREREEQIRIDTENERVRIEQAEQARVAEQARIKAEKETKAELAEQARIKAEKDAELERERIERQRPDKDKIISAISNVKFAQLDLVDDTMIDLYHNISVSLENWKELLIGKLQTL